VCFHRVECAYVVSASDKLFNSKKVALRWTSHPTRKVASHPSLQIGPIASQNDLPSVMTRRIHAYVCKEEELNVAIGIWRVANVESFRVYCPI
jgi:hypothetical protein